MSPYIPRGLLSDTHCMVFRILTHGNPGLLKAVNSSVRIVLDLETRPDIMIVY